MSSTEDHRHDPLHVWVTMADGQIMASMTLAAGYESCRLATGERLIRHAGVPDFDLLATYNVQQAALCGAAHFDDEQWGKGVLRSFLQADPDARRRVIEGRFADEARAALSEFGLPTRDYTVEVTSDAADPGAPPDGTHYCGEIEARVDLTHCSTGATISIEGMCLCPATGEVTTPSHPDHEGTGMLLFP